MARQRTSFCHARLFLLPAALLALTALGCPGPDPQFVIDLDAASEACKSCAVASCPTEWDTCLADTCDDDCSCCDAYINDAACEYEALAADPGANAASSIDILRDLSLCACADACISECEHSCESR